MVREGNMIKEQRDKQISELKILAEQTGETALHNFEKNVGCHIWSSAILLSVKIQRMYASI